MVDFFVDLIIDDYFFCIGEVFVKNIRKYYVRSKEWFWFDLNEFLEIREILDILEEKFLE